VGEIAMPLETRRALRRYQIMSFLVGVMLLVLVGVAMPLQFVAHRPTMATIVAQVHGGLYIVYLLTAADLARRARFGLGEMVAVVCAGLLPFLAFYVEWRMTRRIHREWESPS